MKCHGCIESAAEITRLHGELESRENAIARLQSRHNLVMDENRRLRGVEIGPRTPTGNTVIDSRDEYEKHPRRKTNG